MFRLAISPVLFVGLLAVTSLQAQNTGATKKAQATLKLLEKKVSVDFKETRIQEIVDELKEQVKGLKIQLDAKGGVSQNRKLTFSGKDVPVTAVLEGLLKKEGLCYGIFSNATHPYDGLVYIRVGTEQGVLIKKQ